MARRDPIIERDLAAITDDPLPWSWLFGRNVLVTGASGFIGSYLVDTLAYLNELHPEARIGIHAMARSVDKLSRRFAHLAGRTGFIPIVHDVTGPWQPGTGRIHAIIHAASPASPARYLVTPADTVAANTLGTHHLLELARRDDARFLFLSSGTVYGEAIAGIGAIRETDFGPLDPLHPRSCYTEGKRAAETLCAAYQRQYGTHTGIARISHTYGPGLQLDDGRVFTDFIADLLADRDILIRSDGRDTRPFCHITDLIRGLFRILFDGTPGEAYNVGATRELSVLELAELLRTVSGKTHLQIRVEADTDGTAAAPRSSGHFDIGKIGRLGWSPKIEPELGFRWMVEYFEARHDD